MTMTFMLYFYTDKYNCAADRTKRTGGQNIQGFTLSREWYHRICEAFGVFALWVLLLTSWQAMTTEGYMSRLLALENIVWAPALALVVLALAVAAFFAVKRSHYTLALTLLYVTAGATTAALVIPSGQMIYTAAWVALMLTSVIAGFGAVVTLAAIGLGMIIMSPLSGVPVVAGVSLILAPTAVGYLLFRGHERTEYDPEAAAIESLSSQLTQVAGKSDIVINSIDDGVLALTSTGIIELINPAAQRLSGWGGQDAVGLVYSSVLHLQDNKSQDLTPAANPISSALSTGKPISTDDLQLVTPAGKKMLLSISVSPSSADGGGVVVVFRDITKAKQEENAQAEFISTASHEMRTPVAAIEGYLGLALNPSTAQIDARAQDYIHKAQESAQHLGRLFQDLLDITKADDGRLSSKPVPVNITEFARDITESFAPKAAEKQLQLVFVPGAGSDESGSRASERKLGQVLYVNVDKDHLREVLNNLIENAIKYTKQGSVRVDLEGDDQHVTVSIADTGIGIPVEDQSHLFQKFYRVDNTDTREIGGTGLGLYLAKRLVQGMGGRVWADSAFQRGSTFYVELARLDTGTAEQMLSQIASSQQQQ